jgi:hypothetical protein
MATTYKVLGTNSDHDTCDHCGKTNLKRVVWMVEVIDGEAGAPRPIGCNCAALLLKVSSSRVERIAADADRERERAELAKVHEVGDVRSPRPWVVESVGGNGGSLTTLGYANGLRSLIEKWAAERWPNRELNVRLAR